MLTAGLERHLRSGEPPRLLNRYAWWQYAAILFLIATGALYALPNLYPPNHAIQIGVEDPVDAEAVAELARDSLEEAGIAHTDIALEGNNLVVEFASNVIQLEAQKALRTSFLLAGKQVTTALNLAPSTPDWLAALGGSPMKYGLDLSGGVHFLLEVDVDKMLAERLEQGSVEAKNELRSKRLRYRLVKTFPDRIEATFDTADLTDQALDLLAGEMTDYDVRKPPGQTKLVLRFRPSALSELEDYAISQNLQSLRNRVNELGVSEPLVQRLGRNRIVLDLPGVQDSAEAKKIIGKVANLEFHMEARPSESAANTIGYSYEGFRVRLERRNIVTGDRVTNAQSGFDPETSLPQVNITLDGLGGEWMYRATRHNVGRRMGVVFKETKTRTELIEDENGQLVERVTPYETKRLINLATVQAPLGNRFRITGLSQGEARDLALLLRAGALAAPMYIVEERTVGASLGQENIDSGVRAILLGLSLVLVFMVVYFRVFGLIANVALIINVILLSALMSILGATLTLPGIAGIVLTVGMAVDANVLIFYRIREELNRGRTPQMAIHMGYERALVTIVDANLTTFIVAIVLYAIGTGPVKGFAVTLSIGIITSVFTAVMVSRALVNLIYGRRDLKRLAI